MRCFIPVAFFSSFVFISIRYFSKSPAAQIYQSICHAASTSICNVSLNLDRLHRSGSISGHGQRGKAQQTSAVLISRCHFALTRNRQALRLNKQFPCCRHVARLTRRQHPDDSFCWSPQFSVIRLSTWITRQKVEMHIEPLFLFNLLKNASVGIVNIKIQLQITSILNDPNILHKSVTCWKLKSMMDMYHILKRFHQ